MQMLNGNGGLELAIEDDTTRGSVFEAIFTAKLRESLGIVAGLPDAV